MFICLRAYRMQVIEIIVLILWELLGWWFLLSWMWDNIFKCIVWMIIILLPALI